jgi:4'-phosphopantetheinyl transferase EntD
MKIWKLVKTLSNPKDPQWELLIKLTLGDEVHSDRKKGFLLSREALIEALKTNHVSANISELALDSHSTLTHFPQFTISLSHTKECGASLVADRQTFRSVGIDIEHEERVVKDSIFDRISHPQDRKLRNIELWCLKEAAFKALMNSGNFEKPIEFSSIEIGNDIWTHSPSGLKGEWEMDFVKPFVIARAFLKN